MAEKRSEPGMVLTALFWGLMVGFVGFIVGFLGPLLFSTSNIGPVLGFILGPLGVVAGAGFGVIKKLLE